MLAIPTRRAALLSSASYANKLLSIQRSSLIAYYKNAETSGTTIVDSSGNARNGTYTGVDLAQTGIGDGGPAPLFDGTNDYGNIYSAGLAAAFNKDEGTVSCWAKVSNSGVWTDATVRRVFLLRADGSNQVTINRTTVNNQLAVQLVAAGTNKIVNITTSSVAWLYLAVTWSKAADQMIAYIGGAQSGTTQTGLGTWVGVLAAANTVLGATSTTPTNPWLGYLAHVALWSTPLTAAEIARLAVVSG